MMNQVNGSAPAAGYRDDRSPSRSSTLWDQNHAHNEEEGLQRQRGANHVALDHSLRSSTPETEYEHAAEDIRADGSRCHSSLLPSGISSLHCASSTSTASCAAAPICGAPLSRRYRKSRTMQMLSTPTAERKIHRETRNSRSEIKSTSKNMSSSSFSSAGTCGCASCSNNITCASCSSILLSKMTKNYQSLRHSDCPRGTRPRRRRRMMTNSKLVVLSQVGIMNGTSSNFGAFGIVPVHHEERKLRREEVTHEGVVRQDDVGGVEQAGNFLSGDSSSLGREHDETIHHEPDLHSRSYGGTRSSLQHLKSSVVHHHEQATSSMSKHEHGLAIDKRSRVTFYSNDRPQKCSAFSAADGAYKELDNTVWATDKWPRVTEGWVKAAAEFDTVSKCRESCALFNIDKEYKYYSFCESSYNGTFGPFGAASKAGCTCFHDLHLGGATTAEHFTAVDNVQNQPACTIGLACATYCQTEQLIEHRWVEWKTHQNTMVGHLGYHFGETVSRDHESIKIDAVDWKQAPTGVSCDDVFKTDDRGIELCCAKDPHGQLRIEMRGCNLDLADSLGTVLTLIFLGFVLPCFCGCLCLCGAVYVIIKSCTAPNQQPPPPAMQPVVFVQGGLGVDVVKGPPPGAVDVVSGQPGVVAEVTGGEPEGQQQVPPAEEPIGTATG
ncbi:unnamed protein product [Amoebophrya sp. A25]|nr:unnamed protein product [Amoebophrya sp. A25]|eukprot:GSA25T00013987001.1